MIGLLGGSFDPIHQGHIQLALTAAHLLSLHQVRFVPCASNVLKACGPEACAEDRLHMLRLAIRAYPVLSVDARELMQGGLSYTIDTLSDIKKEEPEETFCLIMAADALGSLDRWKSWQLLFKYAHFVVARRAGYQSMLHSTLSEFLALRQVQAVEALYTSSAGSLFWMPGFLPDISGTKLRALLQDKRFEIAKPDLNKEVLSYIKKRGLYISC